MTAPGADRDRGLCHYRRLAHTGAAEHRRAVANLLLDNVQNDGRSDDQIRGEFRARLDGRDPGMSFAEVFGERQ